MEMEIIRNEVKKAFVGSRKVKVTFKKEAAGEIFYLLGMESSGIIKFNNNDDIITFMAVAESKNWGHDSNRITMLTLTDQFNEEWFLSRMIRAIEKIQVVN